jgi:Ran GTPase-activating protein (RanGAP) involved in mRNA processing and transport
MPALQRCPRLKHLDLCLNDLGVDWTGELVRVLPFCGALESLSLFGCGVSGASARLLASQLAQCRALRKLDLRQNGDIDQTTRGELRRAWAGGGERDARLLLLE